MKFLSILLLLSCSAYAMENNKMSINEQGGVPLAEVQGVEYQYYVDGEYLISQRNGNVCSTQYDGFWEGMDICFPNYKGLGKDISFKLYGDSSVKVNKSIIEKAFGREVIVKEIPCY